MKPPVVHQSVKPPLGEQESTDQQRQDPAERPQSAEQRPPSDASFDDGNEGKLKPVESQPGLVGGYGTMVGPTGADVEVDSAGADEFKAP